jgi:gamma-glutamyltranspeptidase/glutathione hydrolase
MALLDEMIAKTGGGVVANGPAAKVILQTLQRGGNAVDAAVAGMLATCVVAPYSVGIAGYGGSFVMYDAERKRVAAVDFDSRAPLAYKPELYTDSSKQKNGYLAVGAPGVIAGLELILQKFGTMKWADACAPAIALAEEGVVVTPLLITEFKEFLGKADADSLKALLPGGTPPKLGERWLQKDLGRLIRRLAADPKSLYHGEIPREIVRQVRAHGGILSEEDFARYEPHVVDALHVNYQGFDLHTPPPPSGGLTTLSILKTLEDFDLGAREKWGAPYFELFSEASRLCWDERRKFLGDPDFVHPPMDELLSDESARARGRRIRNGPRLPFYHSTDEGQHTANIVTVDSRHNLVSLTATQGDAWGSHVVIEGMGLPIGHAMSRFTAKPGHPNSAAPGKRVQHNMSPLVISRGGKPYAAIGMSGGPRIVTITGQAVVSLIDFKARPAEAVRASRVHTDGDEPLQASRDLSKEVWNELILMGHGMTYPPSMGGPLGIITVAENGEKTTIAGGATASVVSF